MMADNDFLGFLTALLFIAANAYYPAKLIVRKHVERSPEIKAFFAAYLRLHAGLNFTGLLLSIVHGHYADERNWQLQASMLLTLILCITGALMYYGANDGIYRKDNLLRAQHLMFFAWVVLVIVGHSLI